MTNWSYISTITSSKLISNTAESPLITDFVVLVCGQYDTFLNFEYSFATYPEWWTVKAHLFIIWSQYIKEIKTGTSNLFLLTCLLIYGIHMT